MKEYLTGPATGIGLLLRDIGSEIQDISKIPCGVTREQCTVGMAASLAVATGVAFGGVAGIRDIETWISVPGTALRGVLQGAVTFNPDGGVSGCVVDPDQTYWLAHQGFTRGLKEIAEGTYRLYSNCVISFTPETIDKAKEGLEKVRYLRMFGRALALEVGTVTLALGTIWDRYKLRSREKVQLSTAILPAFGWTMRKLGELL